MQLTDGEDLYHTIRLAPIGICLLNAETLVAEVVNDKFLEVAGRPYEEIFGKFYWDAFAEARQFYEAALNDAVQSGIAYQANEVELMLIRHGREEMIFVTFIYAPVKNESGKITKVAVWVLENTKQVSERQKTEIASTVIQKEHDRLRHFFLQAPAGICILDGAGLSFELINPLYQQLFPGRELLGKPLLEAVPEVKDSAIWDILQGVYQTGKTFEGNELLIPLARTTDGPVEDRYFNFIYQARTDSAGMVDGILVFVIEVTDMVLAKQKVVESERELEQMLNLLPAHVVVVRGREQVVEMINDSNLAYWNKKKEETIGQPLLTLLPELADQPFPGQLNHVMETGEIISVKESIVTFIEPDGSKRITYVDYSYQPLTDANGERNRVLVMSFEVTDKVESRKLLEQYARELQELNDESSAVNEELAATNEELTIMQGQLENSFSELASSNARFKYLIQEAPVAIAVLNGRELVIESANEMILRIWGKTRSIAGSPLAIALPELQGQPFLQILDDVYTSGNAYYGDAVRAELEHEGDFQEFFFNFVYRPIKNQSNYTTDIIVVAVDVTPQVHAQQKVRESEEQLQLLANNIAQLAWMADGHGDIFWFNQRWFDYTGTILQEVEGRGWETVHHPDHVERVVEKYDHHLIKEGIIWEDTFPLRGKDGEYRWFLSRAVPLRDQDGKIMRWFGTNTDITEQKQDDQRKNDFIGMVSHELKTPLTSLTAIIQVANSKLKNSEDAFLAGAMEKANVQVKRMSNMINGFLNISRLESAKLLIDKCEFDLVELIEDTVKEASLTTSGHHIQFQADQRLMINADKDKIGSVIANLISNAVKYSPKGRLIEIKQETIGANVRVSVKDEGMGLKPQDIGKVFDRYFRVESHHTQHISGFGIGLYLSSEIIAHHNGKIWVESESGKGSIFYFSLPINTA